MWLSEIGKSNGCDSLFEYQLTKDQILALLCTIPNLEQRLGNEVTQEGCKINGQLDWFKCFPFHLPTNPMLTQQNIS